ncbi:MAG: hypothetical protein Q9160_003472 [Pyrenula sp. 1 TL-2023]
MATVRDDIIPNPKHLTPDNVSINALSRLAGHPRTTPTAQWHDPPVLTTLYTFPTMEPVSLHSFPSAHLALPLRRDILHRAVIYEGDKTRQGTASTKWRSEVVGSGRKIIRQKGTGYARVRDRKSPIRKGGGVAHGPHPRDFSTGLQRKVYDLAWRTALSYRWRKGELWVVRGGIEVPKEEDGGPASAVLRNIFVGNEWGKAFGRSLLVTTLKDQRLFAGMEKIGQHGLVKDVLDVDVKDLLETGRIIIEKEALESLLLMHQSDLGRSIPRSTLERVVQLKKKEQRDLQRLERQELREALMAGVGEGEEVEDLGDVDDVAVDVAREAAVPA